MGRVSFDSPGVVLKAPAAEVFAFLSNLDHLEKLMPEQVINWKSDKVSCSFDIRGMAHIELLMGERVEPEKVTILSGPGNPIELQMVFQWKENASGACDGHLTLEAKLSMMLQMMASTPLQNLVNIMAEKWQGVFK